MSENKAVGFSDWVEVPEGLEQQLTAAQARIAAIEQALEDAGAPEPTPHQSLDNDPLVERIKLWKWAGEHIDTQLEATQARIGELEWQHRKAQEDVAHSLRKLVDEREGLIAELDEARAKLDAAHTRIQEEKIKGGKRLQIALDERNELRAKLTEAERERDSAELKLQAAIGVHGLATTTAERERDEALGKLTAVTKILGCIKIDIHRHDYVEPFRHGLTYVIAEVEQALTATPSPTAQQPSREQVRELLEQLEEWFASESGPIYGAYENTDLGHYEYGDGGDLSWEETLAQVRDLSIPSIQLGCDHELPEVGLYRSILQSLASAAPAADGGGEEENERTS